MREKTEIVHPATGELISLADTRGCAIALNRLRVLEAKLKEMKAALTSAIVEESARLGTRSFGYDGGVLVKVSEEKHTTWDIEELDKLIDAGLPESRYAELVSTEVSYKVSAFEARRIAATNPRYAEIIERARSEAEPTPRVSVSLRRGSIT